MPVLVSVSAAAEPVPAPGFEVEPVAVELRLPSGLAGDGAALLVTDLATGRVVRVAADGSVVDLVPALPVGRDVMGEPTGPYKVRVRDGRAYVSQGWPDVARQAGWRDHAVLSFGLTGGGPARVLGNDFWNPYDLEWGGDGWYVADAGRNALMRLTGATVEQVFAFPRLRHPESSLGSLSPTEFTGDGDTAVDAVPTGVAIAGDRVYVALFGGFPYITGGGVVVSLPKSAPAPRARREVVGLDAPVDVAFAEDGRLLVLEMGRYDLAAGFVVGTGRLLAIELATGEREVLLQGLGLPVTVEPLPGGGVAVPQLVGGVLRLRPKP